MQTPDIVEEDIVPPQQYEEDEKKPIIPQNGGTLNISIRKPVTLNPLLNNEYTVDQLLKLVFDPLIKIDEQLKAEYVIAENVEISQDGITCTIFIDKSYRWHDETPITAKDVIFTLNTIINAPLDTTYKNCVDNIMSFSEIDESTVKILLKQPFSGILNSLCFPVIPAHYYENETDPLSEKNMKPLGSGRYKFVKLTQKELNLTINKSHVSAPFIDNIRAKITSDNETDLYSFEQEIIDAIDTDTLVWGKYSGTKATNISEYTTNNYEFIGFNFNKPLFREKAIRQAIAYMIPKQQIITDFYLGHAEEANNPISPQNWLYEENVKKYPYNIETAKLLLRGNGFIDEENKGILVKTIDDEKIEATFTILVNSENNERIEIANLIAEELKKIKIEVEVDEREYEEYLEKLENKDYDLFIGGWQLSTIPDLTFAFHSSQITNGKNFISYEDENCDNLIKETLLAQNDEQMKQAYSNLQKYLADELPYISLLFRKSVLLTNKKINGNIAPIVNNIYSNIDEWFIQKME